MGADCCRASGGSDREAGAALGLTEVRATRVRTRRVLVKAVDGWRALFLHFRYRRKFVGSQVVRVRWTGNAQANFDKYVADYFQMFPRYEPHLAKTLRWGTLRVFLIGDVFRFALSATIATAGRIERFFSEPLRSALAS